MPVYTLKCTSCAETVRKILPSPGNLPCDCGAYMEPQLPQGQTSTTFEMRDNYRGVQLPKNNDANMKARMRAHNASERPERIEKYGTDEAKKNGWIK